MEEDGQDQPGGVFASLRRVGDIALATAYNRIELAAVELQEEKERLIRVLALAGVVIVLGNMAIIMATLSIVYLAGEKVRGPLFVGLTVLYLAGAAWGYFALRKQLRCGTRPFNDTLAELQKDRDWLSARK